MHRPSNPPLNGVSIPNTWCIMQLPEFGAQSATVVHHKNFEVLTGCCAAPLLVLPSIDNRHLFCHAGHGLDGCC
jgi:hypothetical protein